MKRLHMPQVDARYWRAITLASIFGTNLGDLYAHSSGVGILPGLAILAVLAAITFLVERFDKAPREIYYWLVIILIRTGATNIADYLAFRVHISPVILTLGLAAVMGVVAWRATRQAAAHPTLNAAGGLPDTTASYWVAMLAAGIFGTVLGDVCSHLVGQGPASLGLSLLLAVVLFAGRNRVAGTIGVYWCTVAVARTAGTAIGDFLAENKGIHLGLPLATLLTGLAFAAVLTFWRTRRETAAVAA